MDLSQLKHLTLSVALLTLVGCATASKTPYDVNLDSAEPASVVGTAAPGDMVQLPANNSLGLDAVIVGRSYFAASGRECRRLRQVDGVLLQRVACKGSDNVWRFARDLRPVSSVRAPISARVSAQVIEQPLVPSAGSAFLLNSDGSLSSMAVENNTDEVVIGVADSEVLLPFDAPTVANTQVQETTLQETTTLTTVTRQVQANETLWSFAKRTTGNALNWKVIAEINGINDAKSLASGTQLIIPAELVGQGG